MWPSDSCGPVGRPRRRFAGPHRVMPTDYSNSLTIDEWSERRADSTIRTDQRLRTDSTIQAPRTIGTRTSRTRTSQHSEA